MSQYGSGTIPAATNTIIPQLIIGCKNSSTVLEDIFPRGVSFTSYAKENLFWDFPFLIASNKYDSLCHVNYIDSFMRMGWRCKAFLNIQQELFYSVFDKIHGRLFTVSQDSGLVFNVLASWPLGVFL